MKPEIFHVDAFTDKPFAGNPAAVCFLDAPAEAKWMQHIAAEMNLAETAFLYPINDNLFNLRWFTPTIEVDLCGHATLATAHVLWETGKLSRTETARFDTRSGLLIAQSEATWIDLDFPATPASPCDPPPHLLDSFDSTTRDRIVAIAKSRFDYLVEFDFSQAQLAQMKVNLQSLTQVKSRGVIVTTSQTTDAQFDFASRFFAPQSGVPEDPVTGSAHCALGPWWAERLNKTQLLAYQASPRGGILRVQIQKDRVQFAGQAVTISRGVLTV